MSDRVTISSLATAAGTIVLAIATFGAVRSSNRSARLAERGGQRPLVMPSRLDDPTEKLMWGDEHSAHVEGGRGSVELVDGNIYLPIAAQRRQRDRRPAWMAAAATASRHRPATVRARGVPPAAAGPPRRSGDIGFWQSAIRDDSDPDYAWIREAVDGRSIFLIELLYGDHPGWTVGGRSVHARAWSGPPLALLGRHWNPDRPNPR